MPDKEIMPLMTEQELGEARFQCYCGIGYPPNTDEQTNELIRYVDKKRRDADLLVLQDYKLHLDIDYQRAVEASVKKILEAREKEWRTELSQLRLDYVDRLRRAIKAEQEKEADWLEEQGKKICSGCDCVKCMATCRIIKSWQAHIAKLREG